MENKEVEKWDIVKIEELKKKAIKFKLQESFDEALDIYELLVDLIIKHEDEFSILLYEIYYNIGDILLIKYENSNELFNNGNENNDLENKAINEYDNIYKINNTNNKNENDKQTEDKTEANSKDHNINEKIEESEEVKEEIKPENLEIKEVNDDNLEDEMIEDIQAAWENLETAKCILEKELQKEDLKECNKVKYQEDLVICIIRLANAETFKCLFNDSNDYLNTAINYIDNYSIKEKQIKLIEIYSLIAHNYAYGNQEGWEDNSLDYLNKSIKLLKEVLKNNLNNLNIEYDENKDYSNVDNDKIKTYSSILSNLLEKYQEFELEKNTKKIKIDFNVNKVQNSFPEPKTDKKSNHLGTFGKKK